MEYQMNEINFLISVAWAERELLHSTSSSLALDRPRLYLLLPMLEKLENQFRLFDIPSDETQSVGIMITLCIRIR